MTRVVWIVTTLLLSCSFSSCDQEKSNSNNFWNSSYSGFWEVRKYWEYESIQITQWDSFDFILLDNGECLLPFRTGQTYNANSGHWSTIKNSSSADSIIILDVPDTLLNGEWSVVNISKVFQDNDSAIIEMMICSDELCFELIRKW